MEDTKNKMPVVWNPDMQDRRKRRRWKIYGLFQIGSILQWTLGIFFIVTLPLILTIQYSIWSIDEYFEQGADLFLIIGVANKSQVLVDELIDMNRSIQQYQILEDPEIFTVFQENHKKFVETASDTNFTVLPKDLQHMFSKLTHDEAELYNQVLIKKDSKIEKLTMEDIKGYSQLHSDASKLVAKDNRQIYLKTESLSNISKKMRKKVILAALVSVVLALFLGLLLLYLINKPIRHIERAIRMLGNAKFNKRIHIQGPSDLSEVGEHLEWLRIKLNQLENNKQFFIKTISHELKTPLATLMEGTGLLQDEVVGELNAEQHKIIQLLRIANIRLNGLIENLIEYQKSTSTQLKMDFSHFNLNQLINQICAEYQLLVDSKEVSIEFEAKPIDFMADRDKMRIIISNLFSNALKFSPEGGQINIKLDVIGEHLNMLIADQGPGISADLLPHIFTEFSQQETPEDWKIKGSGLGLSLVKDYVAIHNGQIELLAPDSQYSGARFLVVLPLKPKKITQ